MTAGPPDRSMTRLVRRLVLVLLALELGWLVAANLFLNSPLGPWAINRRPEKWSVAWERAFSPYPARVQVAGFVYEQRTPRIAVRVGARTVTGRVRLLPFLERTFRADDLEAIGLSVTIDRVEGAAPGRNPSAESRPPGFRIQFPEIRARELDRFRFGPIELAGGDGSVAGAFEIQVRAELAARALELDWRGAELRIADELLGDAIDVGFRGDLGPYSYRIDRGPASLRHLSGTLDLGGQIGTLTPLQRLFSRATWIERLDGRGALTASLAIEEGLVAPGSTLEVDADELELDFLGFRAAGSGAVAGRIGTEPADRTQVEVEFDEFTVGRRGDEDALARGHGLRLDARIADFVTKEEMQEGFAVHLELPSSEVPDVAALSRMLPEALELELEGGRATLAAHLEARGAGEEAEGTIELHGERLAGSFREFDFEADLELVSRLSGRDWNDFEVRLEGTELALTNGVFRHPEIDLADGWWMTVHVPEGRANLAAPVEVEADVDLALRDTRVLVALFAEMKSWIRHVDGLLTVRDVTGSARASLAHRRLTLQDLSVSGDRLQAEGDLQLEKGASHGLLWIKYRFLGLAVERTGDRTEWKMIRARPWFEARREGAGGR